MAAWWPGTFGAILLPGVVLLHRSFVSLRFFFFGCVVVRTHKRFPRSRKIPVGPKKIRRSDRDFFNFCGRVRPPVEDLGVHQEGGFIN